RVRYHRPGESPIELPGANGARFFVLGPPRDEKLIHRSNPTKSGHEVYELTGDMSLFAAASALAAADGEGDDWGQAFEERYRVPALDAAARPFFRANYFRSSNDWRRIDADWLGAAEQLALALDSDTNNTSLALALELEPKGRVLLFPGDA